jgi:hypothetical protein
MGSIVKLSENRCVRRPAPKKWHPDMLKVLHPEYDAEPADPTQLELFRTHNSMVENARWFSYPNS